MIEEAEIHDRVRAFLASHVGGAAPGDDDDLFARGLLSSLYALELVQFVERTFRVDVADEDLALDNFRSIAAIARLVLRLRAA